MIIVFKQNATVEEKTKLKNQLESKGFQIHASDGVNASLFGVVGDTSALDINLLRVVEGVEKVMRVQEPFKRANRMFHPEDSIIDVAGRKFGGKKLQVIAGPCSVETQEQVTEIAKDVKAAGATLMRGGAFKPRTSPYFFQGLKEEGLKILSDVKEKLNMPVISEITDICNIDEYDNVDIIQVGARNMKNYELLKALGRQNKPVMIKRSPDATIDELLLASEYILKEGNPNVILCERGIRSFDKNTRGVLDLSSVPLLKKLTHLPVVVDPSHALGDYSLIEPMIYASIASGCDGVMIEVHNDPSKALSDGKQSLKVDKVKDIIKKSVKIAKVIGRDI